MRSYKTKVISIHAPAKGATSFCASALCCHCHFNPRSREGSDNIRNRNIVFVIISIHAPAKGATVFPFSSTPLLNIFQSTLPRRERRYAANDKHYTRLISIHAPAKGATLLLVGFVRMTVISIHAPAKGATLFIIHRASLPNTFQSTLPRRERLLTGSRQSRVQKFQFTLPRRERQGLDRGIYGA